ncbi:predicted protein [Histoplasma capsulatum H143]|uniref:Uncharacterized protein n=1 Tax=Ajellomyces capsulatus (strain H143) TaxID=544712 RepID=C6HDV2_AJECH|nr:predicted protein [Histoplasma capsulatum H143]
MFFSALLLLPLVLGDQQREVKCSPEGQGIASGFIEAMVEQFCGFANLSPFLPIYVSYPGTGGSGAGALKNTFSISWQKAGYEACPCVDVFAEMLKECCHDVDCLWGGSGTVHGICGTYSLIVSEHNSTPSLGLQSPSTRSLSPTAKPSSLTIPSDSPLSPTLLPSTRSPSTTSFTKAPAPTVQIHNARAGHEQAAKDKISKILEDQFCPDAARLKRSVSWVYNVDTTQKVKIGVHSVNGSAFLLDIDDCLQFLRDMILNDCAGNGREFKGEGLAQTANMAYYINLDFEKQISEPPCSVTHQDDFHELSIQGNGWTNADFRNSELGRMLKDKPTECSLSSTESGKGTFFCEITHHGDFYNYSVSGTGWANSSWAKRMEVILKKEGLLPDAYLFAYGQECEKKD